MKITTELDNLKDTDIYSLMLFALYKASEIPEYSSLSQLAYILDKDSLLKLCEFYGGITIKIPTVEELETLIYSLLMYQEVDIEKIDYEKSKERISKVTDVKKVEKNYTLIKKLLKDYQFNSGRNQHAV